MVFQKFLDFPVFKLCWGVIKVCKGMDGTLINASLILIGFDKTENIMVLYFIIVKHGFLCY